MGMAIFCVQTNPLNPWKSGKVEKLIESCQNRLVSDRQSADCRENCGQHQVDC